MAASVPSIACIGIIGKHVPRPSHLPSCYLVYCRLADHETDVSQDNPLHISLFPPHSSTPGAYLEFSFLLNSSLDIFDLRRRDKNRVDQDLGLLHAIDERLSVWGWETGTGTRFAIVLDVWGREGIEGGRGVGESELRGVSAEAFQSVV